MTNATTSEQGQSTVPELLREFKRVLDGRMDEESRKAAGARRLAWAALGASTVAAFATLALLYFAFYQDLPRLTSPSLRAQEIVLVDDDGVERGSWTVDDEGTSRFVLTDPQGVDRLKLTLKASGEQGVSLADAQGSVRLVLGHLDDESSSLAFADAAGTTRAVFGMSGGEAASLLFADRNGGARAAMGLEATGEPVFWWPDTQAETAADGS